MVAKSVVGVRRDAFRIRLARADEIDDIQNIDLRAAEMFRGTDLIDFGDPGEALAPIPEIRLRRGLGDSLLWVAVDERECPRGFALCDDRGDDLYLDQLSVIPEFGRRGMGARLVALSYAEAVTRRFRRMSLSTFRDVPWNGPFYRRLGFREIPHRRLQGWQRELEAIQRQTMDVRKRCFMQRAVKRPIFRNSKSLLEKTARHP